MGNSAEYFTISIPRELEGILSLAKNNYYCGVSQNEMIKDLIQRGLRLSSVTPPKEIIISSFSFHPCTVCHQLCFCNNVCLPSMHG